MSQQNEERMEISEDEEWDVVAKEEAAEEGSNVSSELSSTLSYERHWD